MTAKKKKANTLKTKKQKSVSPGKSKTKTVNKTEAKQRKKSAKKMPKGREFKPGQSGNPKGRPPKLLKSIMAELKLKGYERVSPSQIIDGFETILNLDRKQLTDYATRTDVPIIMNVVAISLLDKNKRAQMLEMMMDRVHGKPKQQTQVILDDNKAPDLKDKTFAELYQLKYGKKPD